MITKAYTTLDELVEAIIHADALHLRWRSWFDVDDSGAYILEIQSERREQHITNAAICADCGEKAIGPFYCYKHRN